jgi:hypothetical protein
LASFELADLYAELYDRREVERLTQAALPVVRRLELAAKVAEVEGLPRRAARW